jgi:hypothetical protein
LQAEFFERDVDLHHVRAAHAVELDHWFLLMLCSSIACCAGNGKMPTLPDCHCEFRTVHWPTVPE